MGGKIIYYEEKLFEQATKSRQNVSRNCSSMERGGEGVSEAFQEVGCHKDEWQRKGEVGLVEI